MIAWFTIELMGTLLFMVGLLMLLIVLVGLISPLGYNDAQQVLLYVGGTFACMLGYYMALGRDAPE